MLGPLLGWSAGGSMGLDACVSKVFHLLRDDNLYQSRAYHILRRMRHQNPVGFS